MEQDPIMINRPEIISGYYLIVYEIPEA